MATQAPPDTTVAGASVNPPVEEQVSALNNAAIIAIALGAAAFVLLFVGLIVCCTLRTRKKGEKKKMKGWGSSHVNHATHGHDNAHHVNGTVPHSSGNGAVPTIVSAVEPSVINVPGPDGGSNNPVILNASSLNNTSTVDVDQDGTGRVVLNQHHDQSNHPPADIHVQSAVNYVPPAATLGQANFSNISPSQTEVLNNRSYVAPAGPIVPQQATLLYPTLPAPTSANLYHSANPVANPAYLTYAPAPVHNPTGHLAPVHYPNPMMPPTSGLLNPTGHPGQLNLSGRAITDSMLPASTGTTRDGFTVFQSSQPHGHANHPGYTM